MRNSCIIPTYMERVQPTAYEAVQGYFLEAYESGFDKISRLAKGRYGWLPPGVGYDDLAQISFGKVFARAGKPSLLKIGSLEQAMAYWATAMVHTRLNAMRSWRTHPLSSLDEVRPGSMSLLETISDTRAETQPAALDTRILIDAAINNLSPRRQKLLRMYMDGLSGKEVAQRLEIQESNARVQLSKAKDALRRQLAQMDVRSADF